MSKRTNLKMVSFKLSQRGRIALGRIARHRGWTKTRVVEIAIRNFDQQPAEVR